MCGEWARSRARLVRGHEEILPVKEEMRSTSTVVYLDYIYEQWLAKAKEVAREVNNTGEHLLIRKKSMSAYCKKQAKVYSVLAWKFENEWTESIDITP